MTESASTPNQYIEEKLATEDPDFLLTRLFVEESRQPMLGALHALRAEMRGLPLEVSDPGVALRKVTWWLEEWQRTQDREPRHPVTKALQQALGEVPLPDLDGTMSAVLSLVHGQSLQDVQALEQLASGFAEPMARLEGLMYGVEPPRDHWLRITWVSLMEDLAPLAAAGRAPVPLQLLARYQLSRDGLAADPQRIGRLHAGLAELAPAVKQPDCSHAAVYSAVQSARMSALAQGRVLGRWSRLWTCWRAARRLRRAQGQVNP
ncbi:MAG: squalene/phytoene synthase family protein [Xanthomonadales bacterium]|nr:squalene/phytoene synthase family protein [Xanthomonadales bacterium]